jgi:MFS family permease
LFGIGASLGFFVGPLYAGWRAEASGWRAPILELGVVGAVVALIFWSLADPDRREKRSAHHTPEKMFPAAGLWFVFLIACVAFSLRDFTGFSMGTLGSLFFQQAHGFGIKQTGLYLSGIFIASIISNPLLGQLSDRGRQRWAGGVLVIAAIVIATFPHVPRPLLLPALLTYGFFFMSSYPIVEAALMQAVPDAVRGRVFGFFITIGGFVGNLSHWLIGKWVEKLGPAASQVPSFYRIYGLLAIFLLISLVGLPCLHFIRRREGLEKVQPVPVPAT